MRTTASFLSSLATLPLLAALLFSVAPLPAQQDDGPVLLPKPMPKPKPVTTLLVMCDLACDWKLDGEDKGRIEAGGAKKVPVTLGQHLVEAETADGLDKLRREVELKSAGQLIVHMDIEPIRGARVNAAQPARPQPSP
ncbi:MAG: hypothetical protein WCE75_14055, partial [Terracidiphilus sp.]